MDLSLVLSDWHLGKSIVSFSVFTGIDHENDYNKVYVADNGPL